MSSRIIDKISSRPSLYTRRPGDEPIEGYRLLAPLGAGGFGEVWKCMAPGGLVKAMKIVTLPPLHDGVQETPADQEHGALNRIKEMRHPFLVSVDRVDQVPGELIIVMEMADTSLLDEFQRRRAAGQPGIPDDELLHHLLEAAEVLDVMNFHHGLQHLDVKPGNLLICNRHVKLADFGLVNSVMERSAEECRPLACVVTPRYASPELLQGTVSRYCDQYSLAIVYQELLTGSAPYDGTSLLKRLLKPPDLEALPEADRPVIARALAPNPQERYPSCLEFVQALLACNVDAGASRYARVMCFNSLARPPLAASPPVQAALSSTTHTGEQNLIETPTYGNQLRTGATSALAPSLDDGASGAELPNASTEASRQETVCSNDSTRQVLDGDCSDAIYPPTIHVSDLKWKLQSSGDVAPALDDFITQLVAAATGQAPLLNSSSRPGSQFREMSGGIIEDWFMMPATSLLALRQKFEKIVNECRGELICRSEKSVVFAVEGSLPFWKLFASRQRTLKTTVKIETMGQGQTELFKVNVRIEPLIVDGPSLDTRLLDVRSLLLRAVRSVLQVAPDRRLEERWPCSFGVRLYPILSDWSFDQVLEGTAIDVSAHGIGMIAPRKPVTKRVYLRPNAPEALYDFAVLTEIVRHRPLPDGSYVLGAVIGRI